MLEVKYRAKKRIIPGTTIYIEKDGIRSTDNRPEGFACLYDKNAMLSLLVRRSIKQLGLNF